MVSGLALRLLLAAPPSQVAPLSHEFVYTLPEVAERVGVAGTFNQWNPSVNPMASEDGKTWRARINLPIGRHQYKFVVNGTRWDVDPNAPSEVDGAGNRNSILVLMPADYARPARLGDGIITRSALVHPTTAPGRNWDRGRLSVQLTTRPGDVQRVEWVVDGKIVRMTQVDTTDTLARWEASVAWDRKTPISYAFRLSDGGPVRGLGAQGLAPWGQHRPFRVDPKVDRPITVPGWVERSVMYQIFPDRFANGNRKNDHPATEPWTAAPSYINRFGGDAAGVRQRLSYLRGLGINAVYFNPVMAAPSNHRYDPVDFYRVDPEIGSNREFGDLTRAMRQAGIRVVLDQIFDHVGTTFMPFADVLERQEQSRFRDWFFIRAFPVAVKANPNYLAWYGHASMPKINPLNPDTRDYLLESVDYWHREADLSGWRLDVANEVPMPFWRILRQRVKAIDPNAWILGEEWGDASAWLQGDQWDASMNYPFRAAVVRHIAEGQSTPDDFLRELMRVYRLTAPQVSRNQMNLLSSHDVPRFRTVAGGNRDLAHLGAVVQMTWIGMPSVYYGEELGMEGGADPDNRRPMRWDLATPTNPTLKLYRQLIAFRRDSTALQSGHPVNLTRPGDTVASYGRVAGNSVVVVIVNRSETSRNGTLNAAPALGKSTRVLRDVLTGRTVTARGGQIDFRVPARSAWVLSTVP